MTTKNLQFKLIALGLTLAFFMPVLPSSGFAQAAQTQKIEHLSIIERTNNVQISWQTKNLSSTEIHYGLNDNYGITVSSDYLRYNHMVTLRALDPGTKYFYKIIAKDNHGNNSIEEIGTFKTIGQKSQLTIYQNYFTLMFNDYWRNINGLNPNKINDINGLDFTQPGFEGRALKVVRPQSFLEYSCEKIFNARAGAVTAWVSFDRFDKSSVIWQTNDSRYALYFEVGSQGAGFDKRIVARAGGNIDGEYPEAVYVIDPQGGRSNIWGTNEWHFIVMTWQGWPKGQVKLYIDGRKKDQAQYSDGNGCSSFRIGNNYRNDNKQFSIGKIDELKIHEWAMSPYYVNLNYQAYNYSPNFEKKGQKQGVVAGAKIRYFKSGKLIKDPSGRIYVISRGKKIHISDLNALSRYKSLAIINVTWDEVGQYPDGGKFYAWSRFPDGTLLKGSDAKVYWVWDGQKRHIASEQVFNRYGNNWSDVIVISDAELASYPTGFTYY